MQVDKKYLPSDLSRLRNGLVSGVRWNDDPLSMLQDRLLNFAVNFEHSCSNDIAPKIDRRWDYLYRSHCGDMQYLHAMASTRDELYEETLEKIMMWLEFTYKVSSKIIHTGRRLRSVHEQLGDKSRELFFEQITNNGKKYVCPSEVDGKLHCAVVRTLFTFQCYRLPFVAVPRCTNNENASPVTVMNIALGSGLHVIQDSLSDSHVARLGEVGSRCSPLKREIGVVKFLNYREQDPSLHGEADLLVCPKSSGPIDVVEVGAKFIEASLKDRMAGTNSWPELEIYLRSTVFAPAPEKTRQQFPEKYAKR